MLVATVWSHHAGKRHDGLGGSLTTCARPDRSPTPGLTATPTGAQLDRSRREGARKRRPALTGRLHSASGDDTRRRHFVWSCRRRSGRFGRLG